MNLMEAIIAAKLGGGGGGGGGGDVTPASVLTALENMSAAQAALALAAISGEPQKLTVTVTESGGVYSANATYAQITAALTAGKIVVLVSGSVEAYYSKTAASAVEFVGITPKNDNSLSDGFTLTFYTVNSSNAVTVTALNYPPITVDAALSSSSENPVQNKVINTALGNKADKTLIVKVSGSNPLVSDKTFLEVFAALNANKSVVMVLAENYAYPVFCDPSVVIFANVNQSSGALVVKLCTLDDQDAVTVTTLSPSMPPSTVTVSGSTPTITPADNTIYKCGELTSLTVSNPPATGSYTIIFTSGATATVTTIPASVVFPTSDGSFAAEANTIYEINVLDGRAVYTGWPLPASE